MAGSESHSVILATGGYDHTIRFWEALSGICYRTIQHTDSQVNTLAITPDKRYLSAGGNLHVRLYELLSNNPNPVSSYDGHTGNIVAVGFQKDTKWMYTGSEDGTIKIFDLRTPGCQRNYEHKNPVTCVTLHPNQAELISGDHSGSVKIWDLTENSCTHELVPEESVSIRSVSVSADGKLLCAANSKGDCYIWDLEDEATHELKPIMKLSAHSTYILKCLYSPDSKTLATASADKTVKLWNAKDYTLERSLEGHQRWIWDCAFSADSAYLVTASSDNSARLWDLGSGDTIRTYTGHLKSVICVALHDTN